MRMSGDSGEGLGATESSRSSTSPSASVNQAPSSLGIVQFGFHAKTSHDADEALLATRSDTYKVPPALHDADIWKRPPPDFRYQVYDPKPPKRNTADSQQPWLYGTIPGQREKISRPKNGSLMPLIFRDRPSSPPNFKTRFHIARPFTAKKTFVTTGMNPAGNFNDPRPHDYRQYPPIKKLGLDEFLTDNEKDPYDIHFKTKRLDVISGLYLGPADRDLAYGRQMAPPLSAKPQWDSDLILNKTQWPQKNEAYTRYRLRHRAPYSAFMERVERDLATKWSMEKDGGEKQRFESCLPRTAPMATHQKA